MLTVARHLRDATAAAHAVTERIAVATGFLTDPDAYRHYLRALHAFYVGIEAGFDAVAGLPRWLPDLGERKKAGWLRADLDILGMSPMPSVRETRHADVATALGAIYVVEGATLGGRWILAHLAPAIPVEARTFFRGYGVSTAARFKTMCHALDEHGSSERMADGAIATFDAMREWIATHGATR